jgi:hypothetical protein
MRSLVPGSSLTLALAALLLAGCDVGGDGPPVSTCSSSSDCPASTVCQFPVPSECGARGECGASPTPACAAQPVCSCAGATEDVCVIGGYTVGTPASALGACSAASADAGPLDSGVDAP